MPLALVGSRTLNAADIPSTLGATTFSGQVLLAAGTAGAPSIAFSAGTTTGLIRDASNWLGFVQGGIEGFALTGVNVMIRSDGSFQWASANSLPGNGDVVLQRAAAASLLLGAAASATPVAYTLTVGESSRSGTDSNVAGANATIRTGLGTGTGAVTSFALQSSKAAASGTTAQTYVTGMTILAGTAVLTSYTVANLPAAATAGAGALAFVTDATNSASVGLGLAVVGGSTNKVIVYSDGTSWLVL